MDPLEDKVYLRKYRKFHYIGHGDYISTRRAKLRAKDKNKGKPIPKTAKRIAWERQWRKKNRKRISEYRKQRNKTLRSEGKLEPVTKTRKLYMQKYHAEHKTERSAYMKLWEKSNPDKVKSLRRNSKLKKKYGITEAEYLQLVVLQQGRCAICNSEPEILCIDHDHAANGKVVRGLICSACNKALGFAKDHPVMLRKMATYLETANN